MDLRAARALLGVGDSPSWEEVRRAYRAQIVASHPDRPGGDARRATQIIEAFATLDRARRGASHADEPPEVVEGDTVRLAAPPDEAFTRIVEACHRIGDVTYLDRSCAILETLVRVDGEGVCSLVITLQGRAEGTDAYCTLEAIEHVASPPVRDVICRLVTALRHP